MIAHLDLETPTPPPSSRLLKFPSLALDIRLLMLMRPHTEMLLCLSCLGWSPQKYAIASLWCPQCQLIDSQALAPSFLDTGACGSGETKSRNAEFGHCEKAHIIGYGAHDYERGSGFALGG